MENLELGSLTVSTVTMEALVRRVLVASKYVVVSVADILPLGESRLGGDEQGVHPESSNWYICDEIVVQE